MYCILVMKEVVLNLSVVQINMIFGSLKLFFRVVLKIVSRVKYTVNFRRKVFLIGSYSYTILKKQSR